MKRKITALLLCIMTVLTLVGCGEKSTYDPGSWSGDVYMSSWLGISYRLPDGVTKVTDDNMFARRFLYSGAFYGESGEPTVKDLEDVVTIEMGAYYFMESYSIWIVTEEIPDDSLTVDDWIDEYVSWISTPIAEYSVISDTPDVAIGEQTFREVKLYTASIGVRLYQDLYITQKEDRICYILVEYGGEKEEETVPLLMSGLTTF